MLQKHSKEVIISGYILDGHGFLMSSLHSQTLKLVFQILPKNSHGITSSEPHCKNLVVLHHPRELYMIYLQRVFNLSRIVFSRHQPSQQFHSCFLNSTNVVGDPILGIHSHFYNYKQSSDKKK